MQEQRPGQSTPPTLEEIKQYAQQLGVMFTNEGGEWFDLTREEAPVLEGMYRTNQYGIDTAFGTLKRLEMAQQAISNHNQNQ